MLQRKKMFFGLFNPERTKSAIKAFLKNLFLPSASNAIIVLAGVLLLFQRGQEILC